MNDLVRQLVEERALRTPRIIAAFEAVDRAAFVPDSLKDQAGLNVPLPIGQGQTISQPYTVAFMLERLQPRPGERVLDVGAGSGWSTALLAHLVGSAGRVFAIERLPELGRSAEARLAEIGLANVEFRVGDGSRGWPDRAPFDVIHVAAAYSEVPEPLLEQLAPGGRLIIPVGDRVSQALVLVAKDPNGRLRYDEFPGFVFVPLIPSDSL